MTYWRVASRCADSGEPLPTLLVQGCSTQLPGVFPSAQTHRVQEREESAFLINAEEWLPPLPWLLWNVHLEVFAEWLQ